MSIGLTILASPLAFDYLLIILLLLLILILLAGLGNLVNRVANWPYTPHHRHALGHKLHEFIFHWHH
jgi:hypothetical protein